MRDIAGDRVPHESHKGLLRGDQGTGNGGRSDVRRSERDEQIEKSGEVFWSVHGTLRFSGMSFSLRDCHIVTTSKQIGIEETDYI